MYFNPIYTPGHIPTLPVPSEITAVFMSVDYSGDALMGRLHIQCP